ncbi:DUF5787 family protein [Haloplanus rubicundus]|uniref:Uncharacterized protein n=1 Tax=Haloplanus rubicundus TaxID=1547898 RepID=A0A345EF64_9EURY|nr:DUF5787 family protein [Haloplanus rubicundus]AXG10836.1 hypothetical protein DU484_13830 [Haloplanus rubicundus]
MTYPGDAEFGFELVTCRWAERAWPPDRETDAVPVVARQLGTQRRRWDTVVVEADPDALDARAQFGERALDSDLLHIVRNAPAEWAWYRDALPDPGYPWRYVRAAVHRADARGIVETRRRGNRIEIRRIAPYPDWVRRIVAVENKPDLDASAARALADQLDHDVHTALADEVWVATAATGATVEPALLEDLPVEAGVLALDFAGPEATVAWHPATLDPTSDTSMPADEKADKRLEIAERAYGSGWRSYVETMRSDCRWFELRDRADAFVPWCVAKSCHQTAAACSGSCPEFQPEPPAWRTRGWPIEGGPGKGIERLLADRRRRRR